jgi:hypothetical protein
MADKITVMRLCPGGDCAVIEIDNTLEEFQKAVGGYIETVTLGEGVVLICDEEGLLKGKAYNEPASIAVKGIVGPALLTGIDGDEFASVTDRMIEWTKKRLSLLGYELKDMRNEEESECQ